MAVEQLFREVLQALAVLGIVQLIGFFCAYCVVRRQLRVSHALGFRAGLVIVCSIVGWVGYFLICHTIWRLWRRDIIWSPHSEIKILVAGVPQMLVLLTLGWTIIRDQIQRKAESARHPQE